MDYTEFPRPGSQTPREAEFSLSGDVASGDEETGSGNDIHYGQGISGDGSRAGGQSAYFSLNAFDTSTNTDRAHWMPDNVCTSCSTCGAPFNLFRRRHHCRVCGLIFCSSCCKWKVTEMRACKRCFEENANKVRFSTTPVQSAGHDVLMPIRPLTPKGTDPLTGKLTPKRSLFGFALNDKERSSSVGARTQSNETESHGIFSANLNDELKYPKSDDGNGLSADKRHALDVLSAVVGSKAGTAGAKYGNRRSRQSSKDKAGTRSLKSVQSRLMRNTKSYSGSTDDDGEMAMLNSLVSHESRQTLTPSIPLLIKSSSSFTRTRKNNKLKREKSVMHFVMQDLESVASLQGWLYKRGRYNTAFKLRFFVLDHELMEMKYYTSEEDAEFAPSSPAGSINLRDIESYVLGDSSVVDKAEHKSSIELVTSKRRWILCAETMQESKKWCDVLMKLLEVEEEPALHQDKSNEEVQSADKDTTRSSGLHNFLASTKTKQMRKACSSSDLANTNSQNTRAEQAPHRRRSLSEDRNRLILTDFGTPFRDDEVTSGRGKSSPSQCEWDEALLKKTRDASRRNVALEDGCAALLRSYLSELFASVVEFEADSSSRIEWNLVCTYLVEQCVACVNPATYFGDSMSLIDVIKIKCIPGGRLDQCTCLDGVVFRKNVTHRSMRKRIENPRVLLLQDSLAYYSAPRSGEVSGTVGITNLAALQSQESDYLRLQVEKIAALRPDVVLISSAVSGKAQELLFKKGISVVQHVKMANMERLSRQLQCRILKSTHQIQKNGDESHGRSIGECGLFDVRVISHGDGSCRTYMKFSGCPRQVGCCIVLRGGNKDFLMKVKNILKAGIYWAYDWKLQSSYMNDSFLTVRTDCSAESSFTKILEKNMGHLQSNAVTFCTTSLRGGRQKVSPHEEEVVPYSDDDQTLGQYLKDAFDSISNDEIRATESHRKRNLREQHIYMGSGRLCIRVEGWPADVLPQKYHRLKCGHDNGYWSRIRGGNDDSENELPVLMWSFCRKCDKQVSPNVEMSDNTWKLSFTSFLRHWFDEPQVESWNSACKHSPTQDFIRYFAFGRRVAKFTYTEVPLYKVVVPSPALCVDNEDNTVLSSVERLLSTTCTRVFSQFEALITEKTVVYSKTLSDSEAAGSASSKYQQARGESWWDDMLAREQTRCGTEEKHSKVVLNPAEMMRQLLLHVKTKRIEFLDRIQGLRMSERKYDLLDIFSIKRDIFHVCKSLNDILFQSITEFEKLSEDESSKKRKSKFGKDVGNADLDDLESASASVDSDTQGKTVAQEISSSFVPFLRLKNSQSHTDVHKQLIDLGEFVAFGRMHLPKCKGGLCIPVSDDLPGTVVAYALASSDTMKDLQRQTFKILEVARGVHAVCSQWCTETSQSADAFPNLSDTQLEILRERVRPIAMEGANVDVLLQTVMACRTLLENIEKPLPVPEASNHDSSLLSKVSILLQVPLPSSIKCEFADPSDSTSFKVTVYHAAQFHALRLKLLGTSGEREFLQSLSQCTPWQTSGGKSSATFTKTMDGRYVLKCVNHTEFLMFLDIANAYFRYMSICSSALAQILGVFEVKIDYEKGNKKSCTHYVVVMHNVFGLRSSASLRVFDLKGKHRTQKKTGPMGSVLLDGDLMKVTGGAPILLTKESWKKLHSLLDSDTLFLRTIGTIDYSLLIGIDHKQRTIVAGVLDYIHCYDLRKRIESNVKQMYSEATILPPGKYSERFMMGMRSYFCGVPSIE